MALVRVREKNPAEGTEPIITYVDEAWLKRWPDDFEAVDEPDAPAVEVPAGQTTGGQKAGTVEPPAEPPARGRF